MKKDALKQELKQSAASELVAQSKRMRLELFNMRITAASGHIKDCSQFKKLRKNIARSLTFLRQAKNV